MDKHKKGSNIRPKKLQIVGECIVCDLPNKSKSVEHIVSESFGNKSYTMPIGSICDVCNNRFSKFEGKALSHTVFVMERAIRGIQTKKGKNVKGQVQGLKIEGSKDFKKNIVNLDGITEDNFKDYSRVTGKAKVRVEGFDKTEVPTSKLLLKMALESLYQSQRKIFDEIDFTELKEFLTNIDTTDWPFVTAQQEIGKFVSIPRYTDKYKLKKLGCELKIYVKSKEECIFKFKYGVSMFINIVNRSTDWVHDYISSEKHAQLYPDHYRRKAGLKEEE